MHPAEEFAAYNEEDSENVSGSLTAILILGIVTALALVATFALYPLTDIWWAYECKPKLYEDDARRRRAFVLTMLWGFAAAGAAIVFLAKGMIPLGIAAFLLYLAGLWPHTRLIRS